MEIEVSTWGLTDVGNVRNVNEDGILIQPELGLYAIADGMGGHPAGEIASRVALQTLSEHLKGHKDVLQRVAEERSKAAELLPSMADAAFQAASMNVFEQARKLRPSSGQTVASTLTMMLVIGNRGVIAHVGDSRIYLLRDKQIYLITEDHNHLQVLVKNGLDPRNAARVPNARALTRAIGPQPRVEVDTLSFVPLPEDIYLLCTDGLHALLSREEVGSILGSEPLETASERFIALAKERGAPDNVSCIVVKISARDTRSDSVAHKARLEMEALSSLELFGNLEYLDILELMGRFEERHVKAGEVIFRQGSTGTEMYVIVEGKVAVRKDNTLIRFLEAGSHFGEFALIDHEPRSATVVAVENTHVLVLTPEQFDRLKREDPARALAFYEVLSKRLSLNLREVIDLLMTKTGINMSNT